QLQLVSPLPAPTPYTGPTGGLAERRYPESYPASPVCTARTSRRVPRPRPPAVPGTHQMALRPSTASQRVPLPSPPESSLPALADPASDSLRAASPTVSRFLATVVTDPSFESTAECALVAELGDFAAHCRPDYTASLVAEYASVCPPFVEGECALSTNVLEDRQEEFQCFAAALPHLVSTLLAPEGDPDAPDIPTPRSYAEAIEGPYSSQWQAAMDAEMASWKSTDTYLDEVPPPGANIVSGMWIFRVKRPPGSPPVFKARYVARGFRQRQGVDYFQTFSPTPKMTTLRVLLHVAAQRDYELHSLDFSTAFLQGSLHEEIWLRRPPGFTGSLPLLPPGPAPTCVPCVEGRQRAAPQSSSFPPIEAPLQTFHMDVWGPACVCGQGHERYFLLVVDDYSRYTTVFPLRRKDRGGEFSSDLLRAFCRVEGIRQTFTLPASPQQNGIAERRIGMVMDVAGTSMIHAAAPHCLWLFAVQYVAHQINLQPRVSFPNTTPTLRWTVKVGNASVFHVWGSRAFVRDTYADKLSTRAVPCVFLGFPPDTPRWQFYHPTLRRVLSSQDVTFDELVSYYRLFPYRTASLPPPPLFLAPGAPPVDPLPPLGPAPSGVSQIDPVKPVEVAVVSGATGGTEPAGFGPRGAVPGVAESEVAEPGGADSERVEPGGVEPWGVEPGGAEPERAASGGPPSVPTRRELLSLQRLRDWYARRCPRAAGAREPSSRGASRAGADGGAAGAGAAGAAGPGGAGAGGIGAVGGPTGVGATGGASGAGAAGGAVGAGAAGAASPRGAGARAGGAGGTRGVGAVGVGAIATGGAAGAGAAGGTGAGGAAGVVAGDPGAEGAGAVSAVSGGAARPRPYYVPLLQQPASPLPDPSPYSRPTRGLTERREPESRPASPESHHVSPESRPVSPESRPESPFRVVCTGRRVPRQRPLPVPGTHSMTLRPSTAPQRVPLPSPPESSLPALADPESDSLRTASPSVTRPLATIVTDPSFESTAASALVAELVDFATHCRLDYAASLVAESAYVSPPSVGGECALGTDVLEDRQEEFECFAAAVPHLVSMLLAPEGDPDAPDIPTPRSYVEAIEVTYVDEAPPPGANIVSGMWIFKLRRPLGFIGSFPAGTQWSLRRPVYGLHQAPREWHDTLRTTLAALGFAPSTADPSLFLRTDATLRTFYVLVYVDNLVFATADFEALAHVLQRFGFTYSSPQPTPLPTGHSLLAPPSDESVEPSGPYPKLVGCLISSCEAEIYTWAMAAQELRRLTYLRTDLGEAPHSPPVLYQCGHLRLAYVASRANTADVFTKALQPCDHQHFCTVLGLVPTVPHLLTS
ncbi:unnamed protein product, partial [Closterium sp. NIES-53]